MNFTAAPYRDDYNEQKDFHKILFKPSKAVQARELTQLQSILQTQIARHGDHIFQNGSIVKGGETTVNTQLAFIKLGTVGAFTSSGWASDIKDRLVTGKDSTGLLNVTAKVVHYEAVENVSLTGTLLLTAGSTAVTGTGTKFLSELQLGDHITVGGLTYLVSTISSNTSLALTASASVSISNASAQRTNPATLFVQYLSGSSTTTAGTFGAGQTLTVQKSSGTWSGVVQVGNTPTGLATSANITDGIFYHNGYFLRVGQQTLIVARYSSSPTALVGLEVDEEVVTSVEDSSLLDPSQGFNNYLAPGGDRYKISLDLTWKPTSHSSSSFISLITLDAGSITAKIVYPIYSELEKTLARRTFDESGSYTVRAFPIQFKTNDATTFKAVLGSGKAYVQGHEFNNDYPQSVTLNKARTTISVSGADTYTAYGSYIIVDTVEGFFDIGVFEKVDLEAIDHSVIGTARVRQWLYEANTPGNDATYRMYLFDINVTYGDFDDVAYISGQVNNATCNVTTVPAVLQEPDRNSMVWTLARPWIQAESLNDISYQARRSWTNQTWSSASNLVLTASSGQTFYGSGALSASDKRTHYHAVVRTEGGSNTTSYAEGDVIDLGTDVTLTVAGNQAEFVWTGSDTLDVTVDIIATIEVDHSASSHRTKTLSGNTVYTFTSPVDYSEPLELPHSDVHALVSITDDNGSVLSRFSLDSGQRDSHYDHGTVSLKGGQEEPVGDLVVTYKYFASSGSNYFTVDSYASSGLADGYTDTPVYVSGAGEEIELRDAVDFRPVREASGTALSQVLIPVPNQSWEYDYSAYLPRIDKIYLDSSLTFGVIEGNPADSPKAPVDLSNAMSLYIVDVPAYTAEPTKVKVKQIEQKRYTMRDIGSIEKRIADLEYYTSLALLEKDSETQIVRDTSGNERTRSGFMVDSFTGHSIGDVDAFDYACSIDPKAKELRPPFRTSQVNIGSAYSSSLSSNVAKTGDLITLPYTEADLISQTKASKAISVNPFNVTNFVGNLVLNPSGDSWVDTETRPDVMVNLEGDTDAWEFISNNLSTSGFGTQWNDWETIWVGETANERTTTRSRSGIRTSFAPESITSNLGDRVVDVSIVPFIRSQTVAVSANGMKPNTRLYPFFDGVDVSANCNSASAIYTDSAGSVSFNFVVPASTFRTGERVFRLVDVSSGAIAASTTLSESKFVASGLRAIKESTIVSTRVPSIRRTSVTQEQINVSVINRPGVVLPNWGDPLAQSFLIDRTAYPQGLFLSSVDLFFANKPTGNELIPVTIEIRETENGYPSQRVVPFSTKTLTPAQVTVAASDATYAATPTKVTFDSPVYLQPGEYALTITSNSNLYEVYVAELGENVLGTSQIISEQPYAGSLFKSQNASTWTAEQNEDLAFVLRKCEFSSLSGSAVFNYTRTSGSKTWFDNLYLNSADLQFNEATIAWAIKTATRNGNVLASDYTAIQPNTNVGFTEQQIIHSSAGQMFVRASLTGTSDISPVIDVQRLSGLLTENLINNYSTTETQARVKLPDLSVEVTDDVSTSGARARYITRRVNLDSASQTIRVYLSANKWASNNIKVYARCLAPEDTRTFDNVPWAELSLSSDNAFTNQYSQFIDYQYDLSNAQLLVGTGFGSFITFAIKIVMLSSNTSYVPRIKDLRVIALES